MRILLTSTSFQDTPGEHQTMLEKQGFQIDKLRGPLKEQVLLDIIADYDGIICGDDDITRLVIERGKSGKLRVISKYGIGLDKIDLAAAKDNNIPVTSCPGVNQITVAEHVFALLLSYIKNIIPESEHIKNQKWVRLIGTELNKKTMGIIGLGNVGKEVAKRALAFGMEVLAYDKFRDAEFAQKHKMTYCDDVTELLIKSDVISLNASLNADTANLLNSERMSLVKKNLIIVNTARAGLVDQDAILHALSIGQIRAYLTDVLEEEPMVKDHPFLAHDNIIITPHIGSRTYENVVNQGMMAVENLLNNIHT